MEACITITCIAVVLLQRNPEQPREWVLIATWGHYLEALEQSDSQVLLELMVLHEGAYMCAEFTAFAKHLTMCISKELRALLKVVHKAHPGQQALLIDLMQHQPKLLVNKRCITP